MKTNNKKAITKPIIQASIIMVIFYAIEAAMYFLDVFPSYDMLLCADIVIKIILGTVSLILLNNHAKRGESKYPFKKLFTNKIPPLTWLVLIPLIIYIIAPFFKLFTAFVFSTSVLTTLIIVIVQQFATGFYEEANHRALFMNGLIKHNTSTVKQRLFTVFITGAFFGLTHLPNIMFGTLPSTTTSIRSTKTAWTTILPGFACGSTSFMPAIPAGRFVPSSKPRASAASR